ncbi:hypothetical protein TVAGG3_0028590 [Trichomonas vaginalis G3]|uniref:hypothetical protein n=1 Tax=Trichomonas vaginalis (strain ATCC PRA-98 / G3) TaxID=412133 RepID=UPI0021E58AAA|nr:hypothetical protein TVAGG3_0028590 [Trichomonas vaginalis G3]KAI5539972.1 hypothetical protein TVAGG3_0028590 [Trichomonas vaginalis G3]
MLVTLPEPSLQLQHQNSMVHEQNSHRNSSHSSKLAIFHVKYRVKCCCNISDIFENGKPLTTAAQPGLASSLK